MTRTPNTDREPVGPIPEQRSPHSFANRAARALWGLVSCLLFRCSPRFAHRWRNMLLRLFGAKLHPTARVYPRARVWAPWNLTMGAHACIADDVDVYSVVEVTIGPRSTVSQYGYLCGATHDFEDPDHPLVPMPVRIGANCWLAADVFVAPGVSIPDGVVVGARSGVFSDPPEWTVIAGTPAKPIRPRRLRSKDDSVRESATEPVDTIPSQQFPEDRSA